MVKSGGRQEEGVMSVMIAVSDKLRRRTEGTSTVSCRRWIFYLSVHLVPFDWLRLGRVQLRLMNSIWISSLVSLQKEQTFLTCGSSILFHSASNERGVKMDTYLSKIITRWVHSLSRRLLTAVRVRDSLRLPWSSKAANWGICLQAAVRSHMKRLLYLPGVVKFRPFTLHAAAAFRFPCLMSGRVFALAWEAESLECLCCLAAGTAERLWTGKR